MKDKFELKCTYIEKQLRTDSCEKFHQHSVMIFRKVVQCDGSVSMPYSWPSDHLHQNARDTHPLLNIRSPVPDDSVDLKKVFPNYRPCWATKDEGDGIAFAATNPNGRTGLKGKGVLLKYGRNYACDPVITRVDPASQGTQVLVCLSHVTPGVWCLPGGTILSQPRDERAFNPEDYKLPEQRQIPQYLARNYLQNLSRRTRETEKPEIFSREICENFEKKFKAIFENGRLCYKGYCDDPRNTDNAWMETVVYYTHIPDDLAAYLDIDQDNALWCPQTSSTPDLSTQVIYEYRWIFVNNGLPAFTSLFASHYDFVQLCLPICKCGRREFDRSDGSHHMSGVELRNTNSYGRTGQIQFLGQSNSSRYVRARVLNNRDVLHIRYLLETWGLPQPNALIAVTGGAQDFSMKRQTEEAVFNGILQAAMVTKACIIDGGTDAGVMKLLGAAVQRSGHRLGLIGVAGWGSVIGRESLNQGSTRQRVPYAKTQPNSAWGAGLDPNHKFFVLVDDGSIGKFGCEIYARSRLESILRETHTFGTFKRNLDLSLSVLKGPHHVRLKEKINSFSVSDLINLKNYWKRAQKSDPDRVSFVDALAHIDDSLRERERAGKLSNHEAEKIKICDTEVESEVEDQPENEPVRDQTKHTSTADLVIKSFIENNPQVSHCFRCPGKYRDNITLELKMNSISRSECNQWFEIHKKFGGIVNCNHTLVVPCNNCKQRLPLKSVCREDFFPCSGNASSGKKCDFYFFGTRMLQLRQRGRNKIICEDCRSRTNLEDCIGKFVPGVLVVVQGGPNTIKTVASTNAVNTNAGKTSMIDASDDSILASFQPKHRKQLNSTIDPSASKLNNLAQSEKNCTPIVVVEGSGKAADFIASTWRHMHEGPTWNCHGIDCRRSACIAFKRQYHDSDKNKLLKGTCPYIAGEYCRIFKDEKEKSLEDPNIISYVIDICRREESVTIYDGRSDSGGLPYAIMKAICRGTLKDGECLSTIEKLRLAIDWDKQDDENSGLAVLVAKEIMVEENLECAKLLGSRPEQVKEEDGYIRNHQFEKALLDALTKNSWRLVRLLIQSGVRLPGRDSVIKSLYPKAQSSLNQAAIPSCLSKLMLSNSVKERLLQATYKNYIIGALMDETALACATETKESRSNFLSKEVPTSHLHAKPSYATTHAALHVLGLTESERDKYFLDGTLQDFSILEFKKCIKQNNSFMRELFGTKAHVECVMRELQWAKYESCHDVLGSRSDSKHSSAWSEYQSDQQDSRAINDREQVNSDLFIWSVLMGRTELARIFWCNCTHSDRAHCISRALFASAVARRLADSAWVDSGARELLVGRYSSVPTDRSRAEAGNVSSGRSKALAIEFEDLAIRLMRRCCEVDQAAAVRAISLEWRGPGSWVDVSGPARAQSPFRLAEHAQAERFVDDPAFQACVGDVWHGGIVAALPSRSGAPCMLSAERVELPFAGDSWTLAVTLVLVSGGATLPTFLISIFFGDIRQCGIVVACSYGLAPILAIMLSRYYRSGKSPQDADQEKDEAIRSLQHRLKRTISLIYAAPVVKFYGRSCHLVLFVMLYTYVGFMLNPNEYTAAEGTMHGWMLLLLVSEVRRIAASGIRRWSKDFWNRLDAAWIACYAAALIIRCLELDRVTFQGGGPSVELSKLGTYNATGGTYSGIGHRIAAAFRLEFLDLLQARGLHGAVGILLWTRLLKVFTVDAGFGPLVLTLLALVEDVARFCLLLLLFALGFGAAFVCAARPYPDRAWRCNGGAAMGATYDQLLNCTAECDGQCQSQLWRTMSNSLSEAYFEIYGEHFLGASPEPPAPFALFAAPRCSHTSYQRSHVLLFPDMQSTRNVGGGGGGGGGGAVAAAATTNAIVFGGTRTRCASVLGMCCGCSSHVRGYTAAAHAQDRSMTCAR